jgi:hypothetical protein
MTMTGLHKMMTAAAMCLALLPPGLYTEAFASPPMPYMSAVDYLVEQTSQWQAAMNCTDAMWHDLDTYATHDWDATEHIIEEDIP